MPADRSAFVAANSLPGLRKLRRPESAVISCTITSGAAARTAAITAFRPSPSTTTGSAPTARNSTTLPGVRVVAVTS